MAFLFEINEKTVFPNAETLLIYPFKEIWERDKSKRKDKALEDFAYIEFVTSMRKSNPFRQYPEEKKEEIVKKEIITQKDWKPDELIKAGIEKVLEFQKKASTSFSYYMANKIAIEKTIDFLKDGLDYKLTNKSGTPIYKYTDISRGAKDAYAVLQSLNSLAKKVEEELYEETKNKSDKEVSPFADPSSLN